MSNDFFRASQPTDIYHTLSLWSRLSPRLAKGEKSPQSPQSGKKSPGSKRGKKASS